MSAQIYRRPGIPSFPTPSSDDLRTIIQTDQPQKLVEWAEKIGSGLSKQLTTSQIRSIFGTVRQLEMRWNSQASEQQQKQAFRQLILLKPKLAYQAQRGRGSGVQQLAEILIPAIDLVQEKHENFQRFVDFFEAILAYHTAAGGQ